jgi:hypothetical protein
LYRLGENLLIHRLSRIGTIVTASILCTILFACNFIGRASSGVAVLGVSPRSLEFSATYGQQNDPAPGIIEVSNSTGAGALTFAASTDSDWLAVTPNGGSAPQSLQVSAMIGALAPGTYTGHVIVKSDGVRGSPATVTVTFSVLEKEKR